MNRLPALRTLAACLALTALPALAEVNFVRKITPVDVPGETYEQIATAYQKMRASRFSTLEAQFEAQYSMRSFPGICTVTKNVVNATVIGAVPRALGSFVDASTRLKWEQLTAEVTDRLKAYEAKTLAAAQEMDRLILALPEQTSCDEVRRLAGEIVERTNTKHLGAP